MRAPRLFLIPSAFRACPARRAQPKIFARSWIERRAQSFNHYFRTQFQSAQGMAEPVDHAHSREVKTYRDLAERCRKMAAASRSPGPLLARAQTFEEAAIAVEPGDNPTE